MVFQDPMTSLNPVRPIGRQITDPIRYHLAMSTKAAEAWAVELLRDGRHPRAAPPPRPVPAPALGRHAPARRHRHRPDRASRRCSSPTSRRPPSTSPSRSRSSTCSPSSSRSWNGHDPHHARPRRRSAERCRRVSVMYAGRIVESSDAVSLFRRPVTRTRPPSELDPPGRAAASHTPLEAIAGRPPDMVAPARLSVRARCRYAQSKCVAEPPPSRPAGTSTASSAASRSARPRARPRGTATDKQARPVPASI